jgi:hypothetical protein
MENTACRRETAKGGERNAQRKPPALSLSNGPAGRRATRARSNQQTAVLFKQRGFRCRRQPAGVVPYVAHRQPARGRAAPGDRYTAHNPGCAYGTNRSAFVLSRTNPWRRRLERRAIAPIACAVRATRSQAMRFRRSRRQSLREHAAPSGQNYQYEAKHGKKHGYVWRPEQVDIFLCGNDCELANDRNVGNERLPKCRQRTA